jgi:Transcriptional regulator, AbiEi antitoxin, Type IV TA system/Transcriptional regulator, AbiEi antitoxin N-terminal domain
VSTENGTKLKKLLGLYRPGTVLLASWLERQGISRDLQTRYRRSGWLESVGAGAFKRPGDLVTWQGGLFALQHQAGLPVHAGAMTALSLQGFAHFLRLGQHNVFLLSPRGTKLPAWLKKHDWGMPIRHVPTSVFPAEVGFADHDEKNYTIRISGPERAMLECLHLAPKEFDLVECFQVMEGLTTLQPKVVQELLAACTSVKAKRLFLYMAERANHQWLSIVDASSLDLGKGERSLSKGGVYVPKYNLVVPPELAPS